MEYKKSPLRITKGYTLRESEFPSFGYKMAYAITSVLWLNESKIRKGPAVIYCYQVPSTCRP